MTPETRERRPGQGAALQDPRLADGRIDIRLLAWGELVEALADAIDRSASNGWDVVDLSPWLGLERQPIGAFTLDCGDGTELVLHVTRRSIVDEPVLSRVGGRR